MPRRVGSATGASVTLGSATNLARIAAAGSTRGMPRRTVEVVNEPAPAARGATAQELAEGTLEVIGV